MLSFDPGGRIRQSQQNTHLACLTDLTLYQRLMICERKNLLHIARGERSRALRLVAEPASNALAGKTFKPR
jgi:hypothetical protein